MSVVSECTVKRLGDLPFQFTIGSCGTFLINNAPTIILCFSESDEKRNCRSLIRTNGGTLGDFNGGIGFDSEFGLGSLPNSNHDHWMSSIANYQGFPLVLGGTNNNKLEMLNTMKNPPEWVEYEGTDYPYKKE